MKIRIGTGDQTVIWANKDADDDADASETLADVSDDEWRDYERVCREYAAWQMKLESLSNADR